MTLYKNKYRIESTRLPNWDYSGSGSYFVTICTRDRQHFLSDIVGGIVNLSKMGEIAAEEWQKTPKIRPNVTLDAWVIMPNHIHGIITIQNPVPVETPRRDVSSTNKSQLKPNSLGSIIGQFKSVCTKRIWADGFQDFAWQPRFHDRIIRDETALNRVRQYILNNPKNWHKDSQFMR